MKQQGRGGGAVADGAAATAQGQALSKRYLSEPRRRLVELMQDVNYGRIENLEIRDGDPLFDPPPSLVRLYVFGRNNGPNAAHGHDGFTLKKKVAELFEVFDQERSLSILELMIDDGLPVRMTVTDAVRA